MPDRAAECPRSLAQPFRLMYDGALSAPARARQLVSPKSLRIMAKEQTDRTTLDLFANERRPGRPKTNPLSRDEQLRINKRNQLKRDKVRGLKRVELKLNADAVDALNELAEARNMSRSELIEEMLMTQLTALRSQEKSNFPRKTRIHVAECAVGRDCCFRALACSAMIAVIYGHCVPTTSSKFQEVILLMAIIGIFFGSDTGNTENIAKMIQKQLGKDVADVHDIAKSSKEDLEAHDILLLNIRPGTTVKRSVTGMTSSRRWKRSTSMANWWRCSAAATRKITQNTSATRWAPSATSLSRAARPSSVTGQRRGIILKLPKAWRMTTTSSASPSMKTASRS